MNKQEVRDLVKKKRNLASEQDLKQWNDRIKESLETLIEYQNSNTIFFYVSFGREVDTLELIKEALNQGKKVIVPYYNGNGYSLSYVTEFEDLELGRFGILEPKKERIHEASLNSIDFIVVPGLGFDLKGNRIGYGEGNYDDFMKKIKAHKIALCYEFQIFKEIPHNEHDVCVDIIVTEKNTYRGL